MTFSFSRKILPARVFPIRKRGNVAELVSAVLIKYSSSTTYAMKDLRHMVPAPVRMKPNVETYSSSFSPKSDRARNTHVKFIGVEKYRVLDFSPIGRGGRLRNIPGAFRPFERGLQGIGRAALHQAATVDLDGSSNRQPGAGQACTMDCYFVSLGAARGRASWRRSDRPLAPTLRRTKLSARRS
jgi:hypothetical protein